MDGKYVSDETYKKGQKTIKKIRTILLIVGLLLLAGGATLIVLGIINKDSYGHSSPAFIIPGAFIAFFGIACLIHTIFLTLVAHQREIVSYQASATMPVAGEIGEKVIDFADRNSEKVGNTIGNVVGGVKKGWRDGAATEKNVVCPKCQYKNDPTDKFCGGCGEKLEQKKHCTNCGAELKETDKFCAACGTKVE